MRETLTFIKEFLRHPTQVGAIAPSSPGLVDAMVDWFQWDQARSVVEFGPGTGVFTEGVLKCLHPEATFFAIERSPEMAAQARMRCPTATIYEDSVTELDRLCEQESIDQIDAIICGLPWASFSESLQTQIIETMLSRLRPGGQFATFAYWQGVVLPAGRRFSRRLRDSFSSVERSHTVWRNLPPAFVYRCVR
ncbi:class I SAM-dependent methyltransferase [Stieleria varia]|uniref:Methyltransferase domain protein n=1 Tax=Stieleria varia TaxID=2528005 RepID=A0A5C5ZYY7_9BACT|nr:methyltransferase domain-containing protein [Stieleria varia]TWT92812.1 Methyltransferase domain protein [Stieleria varia]